MRSLLLTAALIAGAASGCTHSSSSSARATADSVGGVTTATATSTAAPAGPKVDPAIGAVSGGYRGFDRNTYPGDDTMKSMRFGGAAFAFTGYWLTPPPGASANSWKEKRE